MVGNLAEMCHISVQNFFGVWGENVAQILQLSVHKRLARSCWCTAGQSSSHALSRQASAVGCDRGRRVIKCSQLPPSAGKPRSWAHGDRSVTAPSLPCLPAAAKAACSHTFQCTGFKFERVGRQPTSKIVAPHFGLATNFRPNPNFRFADHPGLVFCVLC